eukprot:gene17335-8914_t
MERKQRSNSLDKAVIEKGIILATQKNRFLWNRLSNEKAIYDRQVTALKKDCKSIKEARAELKKDFEKSGYSPKLKQAKMRLSQPCLKVSGTTSCENIMLLRERKCMESALRRASSFGLDSVCNRRLEEAPDNHAALPKIDNMAANWKLAASFGDLGNKCRESKKAVLTYDEPAYRNRTKLQNFNLRKGKANLYTNGYEGDGEENCDSEEQNQDKKFDNDEKDSACLMKKSFSRRTMILPTLLRRISKGKNTEKTCDVVSSDNDDTVHTVSNVSMKKHPVLGIRFTVPDVKQNKRNEPSGYNRVVGRRNSYFV